MKKEKNQKNKIRKLVNTIVKSAICRKIALVFIDLFIMILACLFIYLVIPEGNWRDSRTSDVVIFVCIMSGCVMATRLLLKIYNSIWRYAETTDYLKLVIADYIACCISIIVVKIALQSETPIYFIALTFMLELLLTLCGRFFYKFIRSEGGKKPGKDSVCVAIVGAGNAGLALINEIQKDPQKKYIPYCLFDTDTSKIGMRLQGVKICGTDDDIPNVLENSPVKEIIVTVPSMSLERRKKLYDICAKTGCKVKVFEYALDRMEKTNDPNASNQLRDIKTEDFLGRKPVDLDVDKVSGMISGKVVLVTGGGGSIGSELCRQIASMHPAKLIIVDIYENNAYDVQQELKYQYGDTLSLHIEIA